MYAWRYLDGSGNELGTSEGFAAKEEAEAWMGEDWSELRDRGVEAVELIDQERGERLYRMALSE